MFMMKDAVNSIINNLGSNLRTIKFPEDKIEKTTYIIKESYNNDKETPGTLKLKSLAKELKLELNEQRILTTALINLQMFKNGKQSGLLPTNVTYFNIVNKGIVDTQDVEVKIILSGNYIYDEIRSDNKYTKNIVDNNIEIKIDKINPKVSVERSI